MKHPIYLLFLLCFLASSALAQSDSEKVFSGCAVDILHKIHPEFQSLQQQNDRAAYQEAAQSARLAPRLLATRNLPMVVHIVHDNGMENISDAQVQQGVAHLNAAFNATFGTGVNTEIQFCLAQRDPNGLATNGITRTQSPLTSFDMEVQDLAVKDLSRWNPYCYINIWVVASINSISSGSGVAGYAYLPSAHGTNVDGIVVEAAYFGSSQAKSSVLVHEMGHYLGLYHTFQGGCTNNDCLQDGDHVCDTPPDQTTFSSCAPNANSCSTDADDPSANNPFSTDVADLGQDYMDYSSLSCYSRFTAGQSERMNWHISNVRSSLLGCLSCQTPCPAPPTAAILTPSGNQVVTIGANVNFSAFANNATTYAWNIGTDPTFSAALSSNFVFTSTGTFWVKFRALSDDPDHCLDALDSVRIEVVCDVNPVFAVPPLVLNGVATTFVNNSTNATTYEWLLDNVSISTDPELEYTFVNTGVYQLCLRASNSGCSSTLCATVYVQQNGGIATGCDNTFIASLNNLRGASPNIFPHPSGDFFATAMRSDSIVIIRFDQGGTALWSRAFKFGSAAMYIRDMFVDVSGDLIGVATPESLSLGSLRSVAFRLNLASGTFVWVRELDGSAFTQIHPAETSDCLLTGLFDDSNTQFVRLNKTTGAISSYNLRGQLGDFYSTVYNGTIYGTCRRYVNAFGDFRVAVFAHDLQTGAFEWQNTIISRGNTSGGNMTRMYPEKPIVDNNALVAIASGDLVGFDTYLDGSVELVLAKTSLVGEVDWTKQYLVNGFDRPVARAVVATATGYYLVANLYSPNQGLNFGLLIKTNKQGQVEWAKKLGISGENIVQNVMERNGFLYLTIASDSYAPNELLLLKLDQEGNTNTGCDFIQPINVQTLDLAKVQDIRNYAVSTAGPTNIAINSLPKPTSIQKVVHCNTPCDCPEIAFSAGPDQSICPGGFVSLQATPGLDNYTWSPITGLSDPSVENPIAAPSSTTTYTVTAEFEGVELVVNGDFSLGNTGFFSGYISGGVGFGHYNVTNNPTMFNNLWSIPQDHSAGPDNLMMLIDGKSDNLNTVIWRQTALVQPNTDYTFQFWTALAYPSSPPIIEVKINGVVAGTFNALGGGAWQGVWQQFALPLNTGAATQLQIELSDLNTSSFGNDFAFDDISLLNVCQYTDSVTVIVGNDDAPVLDLGDDISTCVNSVFTLDAGAGFSAYLWQDGSTDQTFTAFTVGTYWVSVWDSCGAVQQDTVHITLKPTPTLDLGDNKTICQGDSVLLQYTSDGIFSQFSWSPAFGLSCDLCPSPMASPAVSTVYYLAASTADGCSNLDSVTVTVRPTYIISQDIAQCANEPWVYNGSTYTNPGTYVHEYLTTEGCDSIVVTVLTFLPLPTKSTTLNFCSGGSVTIGGVSYDEPGTVIDTIPGNPGCDTIVTYQLIKNPLLTRSETIEFCSGETIVIGGVSYSQSGVVVDTLSGDANSCDTIVTYQLIRKPLLTRSETIEFCSGETIVIGGLPYTQPGIVLDTVPSTTGGCDTVITYTLQLLTPAPSTVEVKCPLNIGVATNSGAGATVVNYPLPTTSTDCPCPGVSLTLSAGLPSGSAFPPGLTTVCYVAKDSCGNSASCCFNVFVREEQACDIKVNGCMKYELLNITADPGQNYTYRIRVTNNCPNKLIYSAIQVPNGVVAMEPAGGSIFEAPSGRDYSVNSPNFAPFYSIRFKSTTDSIWNGESDIFKYKLPAQAVPSYINITSRLSPQIFVEAHLNTFYCPIGITPPGRGVGERDSEISLEQPALMLFPNPSSGELWADLASWEGEVVQARLYDAFGQLLQTDQLTAAERVTRLQVPAALPAGLYILDISNGAGKHQAGRFVLQR